MRHLNDEELILHHYGEAAGIGGRSSRAIAGHLDGCARCRAAYEELCGVLAATTTWEPPARDAAYGERVWGRVRSRLAAMAAGVPAAAFVEPLPVSGPQRWAGALADLLRPRRLLLAAYGVAVAVLTILLAQPVQKEAAVPAEGARIQAQDEARERVLLTSLGDHFDRSQLMLLELANREQPAFDASGAQAWAQDLIATNRLYRRAAASEGEAAFADVLTDLERVLLHVAHTPEEGTMEPTMLETTRVEARDMLFKLRVAGDTIRARERAAFASTMDE